MAFRKLLGVVAAFGALYAVLWAIASGFSDLEETISHSRQIAAAFHAGSDFVEQFRQTQGRLPTNSEFGEWTSAQPDRPHAVRYIYLRTSGPPTELIQRFGPAPAGVTFWNIGEENGLSTTRPGLEQALLSLLQASTHISGSSIGDVMIAVLAVFALGMLAWKLWPRPTRRSSGPAERVR